MTERKNAHYLGLHRVIKPAGVLPQAAIRIDNSAPGYDNEIVIDVQTLNIDSASFHQITESVGKHEDIVAKHITDIIRTRGKMQNPVTGSGGMLLGCVKAIGPDYDNPQGLKAGDRVATLVSLTLTPLYLESVNKIYFERDQVDVTATAYLWPSSPIVAMPHDLDEKMALSALDVCGAPAQTARLCKGAKRVLIMGMGKSGVLCALAARNTLGKDAQIIGFDLFDDTLKKLKEAQIIDDYKAVNAKRPAEVLAAIEGLTQGHLCDLVVNTCNVENTEMSAILATKDRGRVYFFNMATSFAKAALGCEGAGKDVDLYIGNGYATGHAKLTLDLVRQYGIAKEILSGRH